MTPRRILVGGWFVFLLYAWPGYMTPTALNMLVDARYGEYTDWQSPVMTWVWRVVDIVISGPPGMLLVQSGGVLFGGYVVLRRVMTARAAAIAIVAIVLSPPVMATLAVVSEDALIAALFVAATALFGYERRALRIVALVLAMLACGIRDGAWIAGAPIIVLGFWWRREDTGLRRYAIATGAWLVCVLLALALPRLLVDRATREPEVMLALVDIAGTLAHADAMTDDEVRAATPGVRYAIASGLQAQARALRGRVHRMAVPPMALFVDPTDHVDREVMVDALVDARRRLRAEHPAAYARARWQQWWRLLVRARDSVYIKDNVSPDLRVSTGHAARSSPVQKLLQRYVRAFERTPLFAPFVYVGLAVLALVIGRRSRAAVAIAASGIAVQLGLALTVWEAEYRYSTWTVVAGLLGSVLAFVQLRHRDDRTHRVLEVDADRAAVPVER